MAESRTPESSEVRGRTPDTGQTTETSKSDLQEIAQDTPECLYKHFGQDATHWFQYDGEFLFERDEIPRLHTRLKHISELDIEPIEPVEISIRTENIIALIDSIESRWQDARDSHDFFVPVPTPDITQRDGGTATISISYSLTPHPIADDRAWKREQILRELRRFDYLVYHRNVIKPVFEKFECEGDKISE